MAVTIGWVANWAARGTATASASQAGAHLAIAAVQRPAHNRRPADAVTDRANPSERAIHGSQKTSASTATDRYRRPCRPRPPDPMATRPTSPMAAARTTLGSAKHSATKANTVATAPPDRPKKAIAEPPPGHFWVADSAVWNPGG